MRGIIVGQKTHPKGFRLVTTQKHLSNWYSKQQLYPTCVKEDFIIRKKIESSFKNFLTLAKIEIARIDSPRTKKVENRIKIFALHPRAKEIQKRVTSYFISELPSSQEIFNFNNINIEEYLAAITGVSLKQKTLDLIRNLQKCTNSRCSITFEFIKNPFDDATLIAKYIGDQLEKRVPFRRAIKQAIKRVQFTSKNGLKIQVSGRLNGIDIARSEWKREGTIPLHTLNAKIDYTHQEANTIYGVIGIKVWLFEQANTNNKY